MIPLKYLPKTKFPNLFALNLITLTRLTSLAKKATQCRLSKPRALRASNLTMKTNPAMKKERCQSQDQMIHLDTSSARVMKEMREKFGKRTKKRTQEEIQGKTKDAIRDSLAENLSGNEAGPELQEASDHHNHVHV